MSQSCLLWPFFLVVWWVSVSLTSLHKLVFFSSGTVFVALLCTPSIRLMCFIKCGDHTCTQYSISGLINAVYRFRNILLFKHSKEYLILRTLFALFTIFFMCLPKSSLSSISTPCAKPSYLQFYQTTLELTNHNSSTRHLSGRGRSIIVYCWHRRIVRFRPRWQATTFHMIIKLGCNWHATGNYMLGQWCNRPLATKWASRKMAPNVSSNSHWPDMASQGCEVQAPRWLGGAASSTLQVKKWRLRHH